MYSLSVLNGLLELLSPPPCEPTVLWLVSSPTLFWWVHHRYSGNISDYVLQWRLLATRKWHQYWQTDENAAWGLGAVLARRCAARCCEEHPAPPNTVHLQCKCTTVSTLRGSTSTPPPSVSQFWRWESVCVWGAPRIGPFGPIGPLGRRYVTWFPEENNGKRKISNEAYWGSIDRYFLCQSFTRYRVYFEGLWLCRPFTCIQIYITHKGTGNNQKSMTWDL